MKKVLIVVDVQKGFMNHKNYIELAKKINEYVENVKYDLIIFTKFINKNNSMYEKRLNWLNLQDAETQEIMVKTKQKHAIIEKFGYGLDNDALEYIKGLKAKSIDICGLQTDACVYAISLQLWDMGIFPNILINYSESNPKNKKYIKQMLIHQFGMVDERI